MENNKPLSAQELLRHAHEMRQAVNGYAVDGDKNFYHRNWIDKPHRVVYDACSLLEKTAAQVQQAAPVGDGWREILKTDLEADEEAVDTANWAVQGFGIRDEALKHMAQAVLRWNGGIAKLEKLIPQPAAQPQTREGGDELTEGLVRKGGRNQGPSQITKRPPPPAPMNVQPAPSVLREALEEARPFVQDAATASHMLDGFKKGPINQFDRILMRIDAALATTAPADAGEVNPLEVTTTQRGFAVATFFDRYGEECSLQKSSLATEDCVWLGVDKPQLKVCVQGEGWKTVPNPEGAEIMPSRMHLNQEQVAALLPALQHFVETGELPAAPAHDGKGGK